MKKIFIPLVIMLMALAGCERDGMLATIEGDPTPPAITSQANGFTQIVTLDNINGDLAFKWSPANYGVSTPVSYVLEIDSAGRGFSKAVAIASVQGTTDFVAKVSSFNDLLITKLKFAGGKEAAAEIRVVASLNKQFSIISAPVSIKVKPLKRFDPNNPGTLWVPGSYQGWNPSTAPVIYGTSKIEYEGFVYFKEGAGFKFTTAPNWDNINYGDSGTPNKLTTDGLANGMSANQGGYYRFKVDVDKLTYDAYRVESFGLIGTATAGAWTTSTPMTFDPATGLWTVKADLVAGALKFRANNSWDVNYGPDNSNVFEGKLISTDAAITIMDAGNYTVTLDFSRAGTGHAYTYKIEKNATEPAPAKLWIPGGYQASGGNPADADALTIYAVAGSSDKVFEGYVSIPSSTWIKFSDAPDWNHTNYGSTGAPNLSSTGPGIDVPEAGYYKVHVDLGNLTYKLDKITTWGLIGTATPGAWATSTAMTYSASTKTWTKTVDLVNGALKFRANDGWDINYGTQTSSALTGNLAGVDDAITISTPGNYTVTIDLSRSKAPYEYTYKVVKN